MRGIWASCSSENLYKLLVYCKAKPLWWDKPQTLSICFTLSLQGHLLLSVLSATGPKTWRSSSLLPFCLPVSQLLFCGHPATRKWQLHGNSAFLGFRNRNPSKDSACITPSLAISHTLYTKTLLLTVWGNIIRFCRLAAVRYFWLETYAKASNFRQEVFLRKFWGCHLKHGARVKVAMLLCSRCSCRKKWSARHHGGGQGCPNTCVIMTVCKRTHF